MWRKINVVISIFLITAALIVPAVSFADEAPSKDKSAIPETFDVGKFLKVDGNESSEGDTSNEEKKQGQFYFNESKRLSAEMGQDVSPVAVFIIDIINFLIGIVGSVALFIFIVGALLTIVSEGNDDRVQKGKQAMLYSLLGVAMSLMAYFIVTFVQSFFF